MTQLFGREPDFQNISLLSNDALMMDGTDHVQPNAASRPTPRPSWVPDGPLHHPRQPHTNTLSAANSIPHRARGKPRYLARRRNYSRCPSAALLGLLSRSAAPHTPDPRHPAGPPSTATLRPPRAALPRPPRPRAAAALGAHLTSGPGPGPQRRQAGTRTVCGVHADDGAPKRVWARGRARGPGARPRVPQRRRAGNAPAGRALGSGSRALSAAEHT